MNDRLYRSVDDRVIGGVCGGLAERFDIDPSIIRIVWALVTILSGGVLFLLYIVMWIVVPEKPAPGSAGWRPAPPPSPEDGAGSGQTWTPVGDQPAAGAPASGAPAWVPPDEAYASRRAERAARRAERDRSGAIVFGAILVIVGIWFLLDQWLPDIDLWKYWPVLLIALGVGLLVAAAGRRAGTGGG